VNHRFVFDELSELLRENLPPIGIVIISGNNTSMYTMCGSELTSHLSFDVNLPPKHNKGGQSSVRFARLNGEAKFNYVSKIIENAIRIYPSNIPLIIGGSTSLKEKFAGRLKEISHAPKILKIVDTQYDEKAGLYEIFRKCPDLLTDLNLAKERMYIENFMNSLAINDNLAIYGEKDINEFLTNGLIETLIIYEDDVTEEIEQKCKDMNTKIITFSDMLPEANQIKMGFGNTVGLLRYAVDRTFDNTDDILEYEYDY